MSWVGAGFLRTQQRVKSQCIYVLDTPVAGCPSGVSRTVMAMDFSWLGVLVPGWGFWLLGWGLCIQRRV